jgi:hypothetical protein
MKNLTIENISQNSKNHNTNAVQNKINEVLNFELNVAEVLDKPSVTKLDYVKR